MAKVPKKRKGEEVATFELLFWSKVAPGPKTSESRSVTLVAKATSVELLFLQPIFVSFLSCGHEQLNGPKSSSSTKKKLEEEK